MKTYSVIKISTNEQILIDKTFEECLDWIKNYGDIVNYTIEEYIK